MKFLKIFKTKILKILDKYFYKDSTKKFPVFYIKGSQTLPPPLNVVEEEMLLKKLMLDDQEARQILVLKNFKNIILPPHFV